MRVNLISLETFTNLFMFSFIYNKKIFGVNNLKDAKNGDVTFFNDLKYEYYVKTTKATACIVNKKFVKYSYDTILLSFELNFG